MSAIGGALERNEGRIAIGLAVAWTVLYATLALLRHLTGQPDPIAPNFGHVAALR